MAHTSPDQIDPTMFLGPPVLHARGSTPPLSPVLPGRDRVPPPPSILDNSVYRDNQCNEIERCLLQRDTVQARRVLDKCRQRAMLIFAPTFKKAVLAGDLVSVSFLLKEHFPIQPHSLRQAATLECGARAMLSIFFAHGWDINKPLGMVQPPVLG